MGKTIVAATPKGGAGKTTSLLLLAQMLVRVGHRVTIVDADKRRRCAGWIQDVKGNRFAGIPTSIALVAADELDIQDKIELASANADYVLVDLEGSASLTMAHAVQMADFVIVPMQPSDMDAEEATAVIKLIKGHERAMRRAGNAEYSLPFGVLFTRTSAAVRTRTFKSIQANLIAARVPIFSTEMHERDAYRAFYSFRTTLDQLSSKDAPNVDKAIENAHEFMQEVLDAVHGRKDLLPPEPVAVGA